jgi:hypothetical protein
MNEREQQQREMLMNVQQQWVQQKDQDWASRNLVVNK